MELHERIRELRKNYLKMSQTAFGEKLGVSRDVIKNIELNVLARPEQKLSLIKLMCKEFNVNEDWLLNGNGPMFAEPDTFSLDEFMKQRGSTELETQILKAYFTLDPSLRQTLVKHFKKYLNTSTHEATDSFKQETKQPARKVESDTSKVSELVNNNKLIDLESSNPAAFVPDTPEELEALYPPVDIDHVNSYKDDIS